MTTSVDDEWAVPAKKSKKNKKKRGSVVQDFGEECERELVPEEEAEPMAADAYDDPWGFGHRRLKKDVVVAEEISCLDAEPLPDHVEDITPVAEPAEDAFDTASARATDEDSCVDTPVSMVEYEHNDAQDDETPANPDMDTEHHLFLSCMTCIRMILIVFTGDCPFSALKPFHNPEVSMMAFTTCRKCVNDRKKLNNDAERFGKEAEIALSNLHMSPKLITNSHVYKIASTISPTKVDVLQDQCGVKYYPMHGFLDEMTEGCMIMGVLTDETMQLEKEKLLMPFVPGAFL